MPTADALNQAVSVLTPNIVPAFTGLVAQRGRNTAGRQGDAADAQAEGRLRLALLEYERQTGTLRQALSDDSEPWSPPRVRQVLAAAVSTPVFLRLAGQLAGPLTLGLMPRVIDVLAGEIADKERTAFNRWLFEQQSALQERMAGENRAHQEALARYQRESMLKAAEAGKLFENWPLTLVPSQILGSHGDEQPPLRIFLSPPRLSFDRFAGAEQGRGISDIEGKLSDRLRGFLEAHYPLRGEHGAEFLAGAWDSKRFRNEASIKAMFGMLRSEPALVLEWDGDRDDLSLRVAYWGLGQDLPTYTTLLSRLPAQALLEEMAKQRARAWRPVREALRAQGRSDDEIARLGGVRAANLRMLDEEEALAQAGIDPRQLELTYQVDDDEIDTLAGMLGDCLCLVTGWVLDAHYLVHADVPPRLPGALAALGEAAQTAEVVEPLVVAYEAVYRALAEERPHRLAAGLLDLALSMATLPDRSYAHRLSAAAIAAWVQLRQAGAVALTDPALVVADGITETDRLVLGRLVRLYTALENDAEATRLQALLAPAAATTATPPATDTQRSIPPAYTVFIDGHRVNTPSISHDASLLFVPVQGEIDERTGKPKTDKYSGDVQVRRLEHGELLRSLSRGKDQMMHAVLSADARTIVTANAFGNLFAWDAATGTRRWEAYTFTNFGPYQQIRISPDGDWVLGVSLTSTPSDATLTFRVVHLGTGKEIAKKAWRNANSPDIAVSRNLRTAALFFPGRRTEIYELPTLRLLHQIPITMSYARAVTGDGLTYIGEQGGVEIWDVLSVTVRRKIPGRFLGLSPDERTLYVARLEPNDKPNGALAAVEQWDVTTGDLRAAARLERAVPNAFEVRRQSKGSTAGYDVPTRTIPQLSADGRMLVTRSASSGALALYDVQTGGVIGTLTAPPKLERAVVRPHATKPLEPTGAVSLAISPDGSTVLVSEFMQTSGAQSARITVWRPFAQTGTSRTPNQS